jgi:prepilin-type N-terminal cleavage/methylation domain-containing protein
MKRENGFTLIELMAALAILIIVVSGATAALILTQHAADQAILEANVQENLRAGMHFIVRDLMQAGEGIPPEGIALPNTAAGVSNVNRPGTGTIFANNGVPGIPSYLVLPPVVPGSQLGEAATSVNPKTNAVLVAGAAKTDVINIFYADNTLVDAAGHYLNSFPIIQGAAPGPACAGAMAANGSSITLAAGCFTMPGIGNTPIATGNLLLFTNPTGTALAYVTSVAGQTIKFAAADPAKLNQTGLPNNTLATLVAAGQPTAVTRVWMVTYYIDSATNQACPALTRQVNYPNYPAAAPANPPQPIAECVESLSVSYDIFNSTAPAGTYPLGPGDAPQPVSPDLPSQIRAVNVFLAARSEVPYIEGANRNFVRNNISTQVSLRSVAFVNQFNISATAPQ